MSDPYDRTLRALAREVARRRKIPLAEGVYVGLLGPSYETPAEIRMWDDQRSADRFVRTAGPALSRTARKGYRAAFGPVLLAGRPAVRYVLAPEAWTGWVRVPEVGVEGKPSGSP